MLVHEAHTNFDIFVVIADKGEHLLAFLRHFEDLYGLLMWSENVFCWDCASFRAGSGSRIAVEGPKAGSDRGDLLKVAYNTASTDGIKDSRVDFLSNGKGVCCRRDRVERRDVISS